MFIADFPPEFSVFRARAPTLETSCARSLKKDVDYRSGIQGQHLADDQAADNGDAQRRRNSAPVPEPSANGKPPSKAAIVVMMIGRKRNRHA